MKLNLGCGLKRHDGYCNVDHVSLDGVDMVHDLRVLPWPWADQSMDEILCQHVFEHIPGMERPRFMEECYRVLEPHGLAVFVVPYAWTNRAIMDYTHCWPPVVPESFDYFDRRWREARGSTYGEYAMTCDFERVSVEWTPQPGITEPRAHALNEIADLIIRLRKR